VCNSTMCVYNMDTNGHQVIVCLCADDLLIISIDDGDIESIVEELRKSMRP
jgi:hypothetical protein